MSATSVRRRGQTAILFTLAAVPLFGIMGLAVDIGWAHFRREAAQTAADSASAAAALGAYTTAAGGSMLCSTPHIACYASEYTCPATLSGTPADNIQAGCMYARDNGFVTAGNQKVTIQAGVGAAPTSPGVTVSYWVVVRVSENIPQLFSRVLGYPTASVTARATTGARENTSGGCVITLNPTAAGSLSMVGTTNLTTGCGVFVNSNSPSALSMTGNSNITTTGAAKTQIVGNCSGCGNITPAAQVGVPYMGDPMADLNPPAVGACSGSPMPSGSHGTAALNPGVYCSGISLSSHQSVTLNPGLYIIKGGIDLGAQTSMTGSGVTIYIQSGGVNMSGGATVGLNAPSSGPWQGILCYQDRADATASTLVGGTAQQMNGALYFPAANLSYTGGSSTNATATTIIANTLSMVGNSNISAAANTLFTGNTGGVSLIE
jgi:Flp pilus assembly protein TadG